MPELSIIVPVYNKEQYIDSCIQSILNQTFADFELILVNDGSSDNSLSKCRQFESSDKRIIVVDQPNGGASAARNSGISIAKGKYIGFIDADDTIDEDMYQLLINNAIKHRADISACLIRVIYPEKTFCPKEDGKIKVLTRDEALCLFFKGYLEESANNKIYNLEKVRDVKFEGRINEDVLYNCKTLLVANKVVLENRVKYSYLIRDNSISMVGFDMKYLETLLISSRMMELVKDTDTSCIQEAKNFDVIANISILNLILLAGKKHYEEQYKQVASRLKEYAPFILSSPSVRKKHKYAYRIFALSPRLYKWFLYAYGITAKSDVIQRTSQKNTAGQKSSV